MKKKYNLFLFFCLLTTSIFGQENNKVKYLTEYFFKVQEGTEKIQFKMLIPQHIKNVQHIDTIIYSLAPSRIYEEDGDRFALFDIKPKQGDFTIKVFTQVDLNANDFSKKSNYVNESSEDISLYLLPEKYIESDQDILVEQAKSLRRKSERQTIQSIYNFVNKNLTYTGYNPADVGALRALETRNGDCTEFADLFVTLCRANKIPARVIEGYKTKNITMPKHNWAEVYLPDLGWTVVDPTVGSFKNLDNAYIKLSANRTNKSLSGFHYWYYLYWGDPVKIEEKITVL